MEARTTDLVARLNAAADNCHELAELLREAADRLEQMELAEFAVPKLSATLDAIAVEAGSREWSELPDIVRELRRSAKH